MAKDEVLQDAIVANGRELLGVSEELQILENEKLQLPAGHPRALGLSRQIRRLARQIEDAAEAEEDLTEEAAARNEHLLGRT